MSDDVKRMDVAEFCSEGYLQEMNRLFLHPLGLALEVVRDDAGVVEFGGVWDYRDDPEGIVFEATDLAPYATHVRDLWHERVPVREAALGWIVQPATRSDEEGADA